MLNYYVSKTTLYLGFCLNIKVIKVFSPSSTEGRDLSVKCPQPPQCLSFGECGHVVPCDYGPLDKNDVCYIYVK